MKVEVDILSAEEWRKYSERAHAVCFNEHKPADWDRIDFALVARSGETLLGYVTCRESSAKDLYWQYGGAFPGCKHTIGSWEGYKALVEYCRARGYQSISTMIENENVSMLKMAMKVGYRIVGCRSIRGKILLEHLLEMNEIQT